MKTQSVIFPSAKGHFLTGKLHQPVGPVRGVALFAHCFTCTMQSRAALGITSELARHGLTTLRFDFTGLGASEGDFGTAGFASDVADLVAGYGDMMRIKSTRQSARYDPQFAPQGGPIQILKTGFRL